MVKNDKVVDTRIYSSGVSRTQQHMKDECDINKIMARVRRGSAITHINNRVPMYGDFTKMPSYKDALNVVINARNAFMALPALVRERFHNDPHELISFVQDPSNKDEAIRLGLVNPPLESNPGSSKAASGASGDTPKGDSK